ncbi:hypothetical protein HMPREF9318_00545 [Streptococcus urinalis FB127-CNA-2]|nr:hypothetical protein HMPREF9318_00545 [Streptococcus urinalis FB127-CNA-2]VEF32160.1 amino acid ABC transporter ATP-binding protein [Streptococcus urinalis]
MLELRNISKQFGQKYIFNQFDLDIKKRKNSVLSWSFWWW